MILYSAADLLWATRIKAAADDLGIAARPVRDLAMLEARLAEGGVTGLIVDLEVFEAASALVGRLRGSDSGPREAAVRIVAFGPHVATDRFEAIRAAGADEVLPRGAFDRRLADVLSALAGPA